ncbi:hypothetical protein AMC84_PD00559 (plasmid) [Rhizobium phaseoli]|nr:hypothetical protein AMC84_PD00559 [Rhizobium phaseoli]
MVPEGVARRQRLRIGDIDDGAGEMPGIERVGERLMIELRAAADMDECGAGRKPGEELGIQEAPGLRRQRQQTDENVGGCKQRIESLSAAQASHAGDRPRTAAPAGKREAEGLQTFEHRASKHAESEHADAAFCGLYRLDRLPDAASLLVEIGRQVAMERKDGERRIFLHHPDDAVLDHAHHLDTGRHGIDAELVDAGADREQDFEIAVAREIIGHRPGDQVTHSLWFDRCRVHGKGYIGQLARESFGECGAALRVGIEEKGHCIGSLISGQAVQRRARASTIAWQARSSLT